MEKIKKQSTFPKLFNIKKNKKKKENSLETELKLFGSE